MPDPDSNKNLRREIRNLERRIQQLERTLNFRTYLGGRVKGEVIPISAEMELDAEGNLGVTAVPQSDISGLSDSLQYARNYSISFLAAPLTWTSMPAGDTEFPNEPRQKVDLTEFTQFRAVVRLTVAGESTADLRFEYSDDEAAWTELDGATGPEIDISSIGTLDTGWQVIDALALTTDIFIRIVGKDGNGVTSPEFSSIVLYFR